MIPLEEASGSYLENITFAAKVPQVIWTINDSHLVSKWTDPTDKTMILPSDSQKREDLINIRTENWNEAENAKHELEELQRKDKKLRESAAKNRQASYQPPEEEEDEY